MPCSSIGQFNVTAEYDEDCEARIERCLTVHRDSLKPEVLVCGSGQHRGTEASGPHQLINLLAAPAPTFDCLQR